MKRVLGVDLGDARTGLAVSDELRMLAHPLGKSAEQAQRFVEKLTGMINCKIVTWDERLSTVAADRALQAAGKKTRETKGIRDQVAAQIILQSYLDRLSA